MQLARPGILRNFLVKACRLIGIEPGSEFIEFRQPQSRDGSSMSSTMVMHRPLARWQRHPNRSESVRRRLLAIDRRGWCFKRKCVS
jgi:hypothetical protein